jgi:hypothetical protein
VGSKRLAGQQNFRSQKSDCRSKRQELTALKSAI